ncbi:unnamed protein product [Cylindrotheca closterium]|uniref:Uncharacterized protein n=1 Tax=Cylindrotheca closterium TaxID=2856 RepID=A0AAD2JHM4_9STRA|nr:unnamed protein product [Cylindrotheca closterium]
MGSDDDQSDEMALNLTKAATDQGQGGLEEKNRSNSTTQLTVDLVKDDPSDDPMELFQTVWHALIPPKSGHKQPPPSKIAKDGALKGQPLVASPKKLNPSNDPMEFVEIVWHALTTAFPPTIDHSLDRFSIGWSTKQGWNQNKIFNYLHTTTILFYDVCAAHQKWPTTMGSNEAKSQEMALKSTRTAPEHAQEGLEATTRSNSTTLLTVDLVKDNPNACISSMLYSIFVLFLSLEKIQQTDFLGLPFQIPTNRVGAPICPLTDDLRELHPILSLEKVPTKFLCIPGDILASCLYFPTNSGSANLSPDMID